jgi:hypothetical protein
MALPGSRLPELELESESESKESSAVNADLGHRGLAGCEAGLLLAFQIA